MYKRQGWSEGITPLYPVVCIQPGQSKSFTIPLPPDIDVYTAHTLVIEVYFIDGSIKNYMISIRSP